MFNHLGRERFRRELRQPNKASAGIVTAVLVEFLQVIDDSGRYRG